MMVYLARVSTTRQAQAQGIEQQLDRLRAAAAERGWDLDDQHVYRGCQVDAADEDPAWAGMGVASVLSGPLDAPVIRLHAAPGMVSS